MAAQLELLAGAVGGAGNADGVGTAARFNGPQGVAPDRNGNIYVADTLNHVVRKIDPARVVTTLAGSPGLSGNADGIGLAARFVSPQGIATDSAGNVYVADGWNNNLRKITPAGVVTTLAGPIWRANRLINNSLPSVAVDPAGNIVVANSNDFTVVKVTPDGQVTTLAGTPGLPGFRDGPGSEALLPSVASVAIGLNGDVFFPDHNRIRRIALDGNVTTFAGGDAAGSDDGPIATAKLHAVASLAFDATGNLYVLERATFKPANDIRKITTDGVVSTLTSDLDLTVNAITVGAGGVIYATDGQGDVVESIDATGRIGVIAGASLPAGNVDGSASIARFRQITAAATDALGNIYVADAGNRNFRKTTPSGDVTTVLAMASQTAVPASVATDAAGNVLAGWFDCATLDPTRIFCSAGITRIDQAGVASPVAIQGSSSVAPFSPNGLAVDSAGNIYIADGENRVVRKVAPSGEITMVAPVGSVPFLKGVAVGRGGDIYAISGSAVYKLTGGLATLLAGVDDTGIPGPSVDGLGTAARFSGLRGVAVDDAGDIYVADAFSQTVRKITGAGLVTTIAGTAGVQGFAPGPLPGVLTSPTGIAVNGTNLYIGMPTAIAVVRNRNN